MIGFVYWFKKLVPPERLELSPPAPEAGALSTELRGPEANITLQNWNYRLGVVIGRINEA